MWDFEVKNDTIKCKKIYDKCSKLYCINTDSKSILINGLEFMDWDELDASEQNIVLKYNPFNKKGNPFKKGCLI